MALVERVPFCQDNLWNRKWLLLFPNLLECDSIQPVSCLIVNLTWYTDQPDFTQCFHSTVLVYLPCGFLWTFLPFQYLLREGRTYSANPRWAPVTLARLALTLLLFLLSLTELGLKLKQFYSGSLTTPVAAVVAPAVLAMTYGAVWSMIYAEKTRGSQKSNGYFYTFWTLIALTSMLTMTSVARFPDLRRLSDNIVLVTYFVLNSLMALLEYWPNPDDGYRYDDISGIYTATLHLYLPKSISSYTIGTGLFFSAFDL